MRRRHENETYSRYMGVSQIPWIFAAVDIRSGSYYTFNNIKSMNWIMRIWRWLFWGKVKPVPVIETIPEAGIIMEVPKEVINKIKKPQTVFLADVKVCDPTPNPNKYWKRFKRGKKIYWKKFYHEPTE